MASLNNIPLWFDFVKPKLAEGMSMPEANIEYHRLYFPDLYKMGNELADECYALIKKRTFPLMAHYEHPQGEESDVELVIQLLQQERLM